MNSNDAFWTNLSNINTHEFELYRVKDIVLNEPFLLRLVGPSIIILVTSDRSTPSYFVVPCMLVIDRFL